MKWPRQVLVGMSDTQYEYLATVAKGRRDVLRERAVTGRVGKPSMSAVVRDLIDGAMGGQTRALTVPSAQDVLEALTTRERVVPALPSVLDLYPAAVDRIAVEELPRALEILHGCLAVVYRRVQTSRLSLPAPALEPSRKHRPTLQA